VGYAVWGGPSGLEKGSFLPFGKRALATWSRPRISRKKKEGGGEKREILAEGKTWAQGRQEERKDRPGVADNPRKGKVTSEET